MMPAVAVNVAVVAPVNTVTEGASLSSELLSLSVTAVLAGAASFKVTVQVLLPLELRLVGVQAREVTARGGNNVREAVCMLVPSAAVTTAVCVLLTAPAVAVKLAVFDPLTTVTDVGTATSELLSLIVTAVFADTA